MTIMFFFNYCTCLLIMHEDNPGTQMYIVSWTLNTSLRAHAWKQNEPDIFGLYDYTTSTSGMHGKPYSYIKEEQLRRGFFNEKKALEFIEEGKVHCEDLHHYFYRAKWYELKDFKLHPRWIKVLPITTNKDRQIPFRTEITYNCNPDGVDPRYNPCVGWTSRFFSRGDH